MDITSIEKRTQRKTSTFLFQVIMIFRQREINVEDCIPVPDTSFRLTFPSNFNSPGPFQIETHNIQKKVLKHFLLNPQATKEELLRNVEESVVFPPQGMIFFRKISQQGEDNKGNK